MHDSLTGDFHAIVPGRFKAPLHDRFDRSRRLDLPLSAAHDRLLSLAEDAGFADAGNSAILEAFRRRR